MTTLQERGKIFFAMGREERPVRPRKPWEKIERLQS
jgi:hypothetical protein